jgi:hypothetical protein
VWSFSRVCFSSLLLFCSCGAPFESTSLGTDEVSAVAPASDAGSSKAPGVVAVESGTLEGSRPVHLDAAVTDAGAGVEDVLSEPWPEDVIVEKVAPPRPPSCTETAFETSARCQAWGAMYYPDLGEGCCLGGSTADAWHCGHHSADYPLVCGAMYP